jgi:hypothetical protein
MKNISNFRGVFSKDMLPKFINKNESVVINLENYFAGNGTHWVGVYNSPNSDVIEYFDSFGLYPPDTILTYMKTSNKDGCIYNSSEIQDMESIMCGYYVCYYLKQRYLGVCPIDILLQFDQTPTVKNEKLIRNIKVI